MQNKGIKIKQQDITDCGAASLASGVRPLRIGVPYRTHTAIRFYRQERHKRAGQD